MNKNKVVLAGAGVLGAQIALQSAFRGKDVTIWMRSEGSIGRTKPRIEHFYKTYLAEVENLDRIKGTDSKDYPRSFVDGVENLTDEDIQRLRKQVEDAYAGIKYELDLGKAVEDAQFIIEAVAEDVEEKRKFYHNLSQVVDDETIILSNSSTFLPSFFKDDVKHNERFLHFHFANHIWRNNTVEVMGHDGTDPEIYKRTVELGREIGMIPLELKKEQPGYLLNSLLVPFLDAGLELWANDIASPEDIDRAWTIGAGAPHGPFKIMDVVGLRTVYNINANHPGADDPNSKYGKIAGKLKGYIDAGKIGMESGEGFYKYK
ncbi:MAG: 3-hydroxyacyl-CoA dehydrogenase [Tissierellia bacterium]|nr:3-hydroxyacyl-CoA dehydrogenase [Tissierellia bacterium]